MVNAFGRKHHDGFDVETMLYSVNEVLKLRHQTYDCVTEWSKVAVLGTVLFGGVGSDPIAVTFVHFWHYFDCSALLKVCSFGLMN